MGPVASESSGSRGAVASESSDSIGPVASESKGSVGGAASGRTAGRTAISPGFGIRRPHLEQKRAHFADCRPHDGQLIIRGPFATSAAPYHRAHGQSESSRGSSSASAGTPSSTQSACSSSSTR